jgi:hypothetical protein
VKRLALALCLAATLTACETPLRSAAATAQVAPRLPNAMLGHYWCFFRAPDGDPDQEASLLEPANNFDDCGNHGGVRFWRRGGKSGYQLGRFDWRADCKISKIERVASKGKVQTYRVHSHCRAHSAKFVGDPPNAEGARLFELWQSEAGLRWRELEEDSKIPEVSEPPACKGGAPPCGKPPLQKACSGDSGVEYPKGYMCEADPNKLSWFCEIHDGVGLKFYKAKGGGGGKRKRDAVCE